MKKLFLCLLIISLFANISLATDVWEWQDRINKMNKSNQDKRTLEIQEEILKTQKEMLEIQEKTSKNNDKIHFTPKNSDFILFLYHTPSKKWRTLVFEGERWFWIELKNNK